MLARYTIYRGKRRPDDPVPQGHRQDTRAHTQHCLRPPMSAVRQYLARPSPAAWRTLSAAYKSALSSRFQQDPTPFDQLAAEAMAGDVYIGCSCPTLRNPDVEQCHTMVALAFMKDRYPTLVIGLPVLRPFQ